MSVVDTAWLRMDTADNLMIINGVLEFDTALSPGAVRELAEQSLLVKGPRFGCRPVQLQGRFVTQSTGSQIGSLQIGNYNNQILAGLQTKAASIAVTVNGTRVPVSSANLPEKATLTVTQSIDLSADSALALKNRLVNGGSLGSPAQLNITDYSGQDLRAFETSDFSHSKADGLVVKVGSRLVDSSLKSKLQRLQLAMKGVG